MNGEDEWGTYDSWPDICAQRDRDALEDAKAIIERVEKLPAKWRAQALKWDDEGEIERALRTKIGDA